MLHRLAFALLVMLAAEPLAADTAGTTRPHRFVVCMAPPEDCTKLVIDTIDEANRKVLVQAYGFTFCPIIEALVRAKRRGADVQVLLDKSNAHQSKAAVMSYLRAAGIEPKIDAPSGIAHRKVIIVDGKIVLSGSMNFTCAGKTRNVEVVEVNRGRKRAKPYIDGWYERARSSKPAPPTTPDIPLRCSC